MSQIALTNAERTQALVRLGYTEREAAFVCLAALHGGFFLRRQYCQFIEREVGGTAAALIEKLLSKGHGAVVAGCGNAKIYHLASRTLYSALGQEDNRNRRQRPSVAVKNRLMGFDFVLNHLACEFLATEQDKIKYFTQSAGIDLTLLPSKRFRSPNGHDETLRYFVDKYPIFISSASPAVPLVSFCFIDEGVITSGRFETYLRQYSRLLARLPSFNLIYVATWETKFAMAEKTFHNFVSGPSRRRSRRLSDGDQTRLLRHFEDRRLYDAGQHSSFDRTRLIRLRDERDEFSGRIFQALYGCWKTGGAGAVRAVLDHQIPVVEAARANFSTYLLRYDYEIFGNFGSSRQ